MLDLITQALNANNIRFERLDGKMSTPQRRNAISNFRKDPKCTVFLATVGSAGVGQVAFHNLVIADMSLTTWQH